MLRDDGYVKMLDFGLARLAPNAIENPEGEQLARTDPGTMLGTMRYMAPEQTRGETATTATDIFALGVVFYELATGEHPFSAGTVLALLQAIAARRPVPPVTSESRDRTPRIETIILRMLEKEANATAQRIGGRDSPGGIAGCCRRGRYQSSRDCCRAGAEDGRTRKGAGRTARRFGRG
jgi:serine/threonine protein kinase